MSLVLMLHRAIKHEYDDDAERKLDEQKETLDRSTNQQVNTVDSPWEYVGAHRSISFITHRHSGNVWVLYYPVYDRVCRDVD